MDSKETRNILLKYTIPDTCNIILGYVGHTWNKKYFRRGDYKICVEIIDGIRNINTTRDNKLLLYDSLMSEACRGGHVKIVKLMVKVWNGYNWSDKFRIACVYGHIKLVKFMLEVWNGHNDYTDGLLNACRKDNIEIIRLIIQKLREFNILNSINRNEILKSACKGGNIEVLQFLVNNI